MYKLSDKKRKRQTLFVEREKPWTKESDQNDRKTTH